jgi:hypothetical protein
MKDEVMDHSIYHLHQYVCIWECEMMTSGLIYAAPIYGFLRKQDWEKVNYN